MKGLIIKEGGRYECRNGCLKEVELPKDGASPPPVTRTIREWLETLPIGYRQRAIKAMWGEGRGGLTASTLEEAVYSLNNWDDTEEGHDFWAAVKQWATGRGDLPTLPDPGYGYLLNGDPVPAPPDGWEIVPEGETLESGYMRFGESWCMSCDNSSSKSAKLRRFIRAYARKKKPQPRVGKPGEVWGDPDGAAWWLGEKGENVAIRDCDMSDISPPIYYTSPCNWFHSGSSTFLAPSLEDYYRQKFGTSPEVSKWQRKYALLRNDMRKNYVRKVHAKLISTTKTYKAVQ